MIYDINSFAFATHISFIVHDYSKLSKEVGGILKVWDDESSTELPRLSNSMSKSKLMAGIMRNFVVGLMALLPEAKDPINDWAVSYLAVATNHTAEECGSRIEKIAKSYKSASRKYGSVAAHDAFLRRFSGYAEILKQARRDGASASVTLFVSLLRDQHLDLPLLKLGTYIHCICRYTRSPVNDGLVDITLASIFRELGALRSRSECCSPFGLATNPLPPPSPLCPSLVTEQSGPARAHEKAPREQRWSGSRARAHAHKRAGKQSTQHAHASEEGKAESIAAGHARRRELREAEQARIDELIDMQKQINIGREIGGH